jgi:hypothetical protein
MASQFLFPYIYRKCRAYPMSDGVLTGVTPISESLLAIYNTTDTDKIMARNEHINLSAEF